MLFTFPYKAVIVSTQCQMVIAMDMRKMAFHKPDTDILTGIISASTALQIHISYLQSRFCTAEKKIMASNKQLKKNKTIETANALFTPESEHGTKPISNFYSAPSASHRAPGKYNVEIQQRKIESVDDLHTVKTINDIPDEQMLDIYCYMFQYSSISASTLDKISESNMEICGCGCESCCGCGHYLKPIN